MKIVKSAKSAKMTKKIALKISIGLPWSRLVQVCCCLSFLIYATSTLAASNIYVAGEILVKYKKNTDIISLSHAVVGTSITIGPIAQNVAKIKIAPNRDINQVIAQYSALDEVEYAQPNYRYYATQLPNDSQFSQLWGLYNTINQTNDISMAQAWDITTDCTGVIVAVIDSGVNYTHQDLVNNMWKNTGEIADNRIDDDNNGYVDDVYGWNALTATSDPMPEDADEHGSHVAGTIGAQGNNSTALSGVCWSARLMAVRVLGLQGGTTLSIAAGINYAVKNGAKILNLSLETYTASDSLLYDAVKAARDKNILVVATAGNDNSDRDTEPRLPCTLDLDSIICVAAVDQNYQLASFSDYGKNSVDIAAPGVDIYSTVAGNKVADDFTSWIISGGNWIQCIYNDSIHLLISLAACADYDVSNYVSNVNATVAKNVDLTAKDILGAGVEFRIWYNIAKDDGVSFGLHPAYDNFLASSYASKLDLPYSYSLTSCVGSNCTLGFKFTSNDDEQTDKGALVYNFAIKKAIQNTDKTIRLSGTSMAAPHVSGLAALLMSYNPAYTYKDVKYIILASGDKKNYLAEKLVAGSIINAHKALISLTIPKGFAATPILD